MRTHFLSNTLQGLTLILFWCRDDDEVPNAIVASSHTHSQPLLDPSITPFSFSSSNTSTPSSSSSSTTPGCPTSDRQQQQRVLASAPAALRRLACLFDEAQSAILDLMRQDSFPRFLHSPQAQRARQLLRGSSLLAGESSNEDVEQFVRQADQ